jgi:hypothetical protein
MDKLLDRQRGRDLEAERSGTAGSVLQQEADSAPSRDTPRSRSRP